MLNTHENRPLIDFGRHICGDFTSSIQREWLVTNGLGGYAAGTVAGVLTRRYHGYLIAALQPPVQRVLLLTKLDETAFYLDKRYPMYTNHWKSGTVEPEGHLNLERFHLEDNVPVWTYAFADAILEKRLWLEQGANTTYIRYTFLRATAPIQLDIKALINHRDHHSETHASESILCELEKLAHGVHIQFPTSGHAFNLQSSHGSFQPELTWQREFYLAAEDYRGLSPFEDHLAAGAFHVELQPGEDLTIVASLVEHPVINATAAYSRHQVYTSQRLTAAREMDSAPAWVRQLVLAADQFIVSRQGADQHEGKTIIAGYPWFTDWGRDTMISLPGLMLATGRTADARATLSTFARFIDQGMLPNRFPDAGEEPEYNTVDATLWFFQALYATYQVTPDQSLLAQLFPFLEEIIRWHHQGTRYGIKADPSDGLLAAGESGVQLTWMDAKIDDWVVTPRIGKPVEINALWYNANQIMHWAAQLLGKPANFYGDATQKIQRGFARYWYTEGNYCYDVIDTPSGDDASLRPNQLLAVSLPFSPLSQSQQQQVVRSCARYLLTSHGLRSLAAGDPEYTGYYGGDRYRRDAAYHQGTVWGWLIGPFVSAYARAFDDPAQALSFLEPFSRQITAHGLGTISEIFDGEPPHTARGCIAQAWSVAEILRCWYELHPTN